MPRDLDITHVLALLRDCLQRQVGLKGCTVIVTDEAGRRAYVCPLPPATVKSPLDDTEVDGELRPLEPPGELPPLDECDRAIIAALLEARRKLLGPEIARALNPDPDDEEYSERTIAGRLAELVKQGRLVNSGRRTGYGLPGW